MNNQLHTILGASGATGKAVIKELQQRDLPIRLVQRNAKAGDKETIKADLLSADEAKIAIKGSTHVYLCVALPYDSKIWLEKWPLIMQNVIDACAETNAILIFLDNAYMYGPAPLAIPFAENHSQNPGTKKGLARKKTIDLLIKAMEYKKVNAVIGRSADFYGPHTISSAFYNSFLEKMLAGKAPQSIGKINVKHTYANTTDNAKALVSLALDPSTHGQVWHLPVGEPITVEEVTVIFNKILGSNYKISYLPPIIAKIVSIFIPVLNEAVVMLYQFDNEYIMSFDKFKKHFPDFKVTPYEIGIKDMIKSFQVE
ncbi:MAG: NAD-dependent epimerase/dehydratase family protein [bacterium]